MNLEPVTAEAGQRAHPDLVRHRQRLRPQILPVAPGIHTCFGLSLANCHVIAAPHGLILVDSGHCADEGHALLRLIRTISDRPVAAILLTHSHYAHGIASLLADSPPGAAIVAHARVAGNLGRRLAGLEPAFARRVAMESGALLPPQGPDAAVAPTPAWHGPSGWLPPTMPLDPGCHHLELAGLPVIAEDGGFDTDDGLFFRFPTLDAAAHNLVTAQFPNPGSVAGGRYRDPRPWVAAIERLLAAAPAFLLPCHGLPVCGREAAGERLAVNRDALRFLIDQVTRAANCGLSRSDIVARLRLPAVLANHPDLRQLYGWFPHAVAAVAAGEIGFWSGEAEDLAPLSPDAEAACLAVEFGGPEALAGRAAAALARGEAAWAARLAAAAVRAGHAAAQATRAQALRHLAQRIPAWTVRNALLSAARLAEDSLDTGALYRSADPSEHSLGMPGQGEGEVGGRTQATKRVPPGPVGHGPSGSGFAGLRHVVDLGLASQTSTAGLVRLLCVRVDPDRAEGVDATTELVFQDTGEVFRLRLYRSVLQVEPLVAAHDEAGTTSRPRFCQGLAAGDAWSAVDWPPGPAATIGQCLDR